MHSITRKNELNPFAHIDKREMKENYIRYMYDTVPSTPNLYAGAYSAKKTEKHTNLKHMAVLDQHIDKLFPHRSDSESLTVRRSVTSPNLGKRFSTPRSVKLNDPRGLLLLSSCAGTPVSVPVHTPTINDRGQKNRAKIGAVTAGITKSCHLENDLDMPDAEALLSPMAPRSRTTEIIRNHAVVHERQRRKDTDEKLFKHALVRDGLEEMMEKAEQRVRARQSQPTAVHRSVLINMGTNISKE